MKSWPYHLALLFSKTCVLAVEEKQREGECGRRHGKWNMNGRMSMWVYGQIFLESLSNISQSVLLSLRNIIINCKKPVFLKKSLPLYVVTVCWFESYSSMNCWKCWPKVCVFLFFIKKKLFKVCILWMFLSLFDCKCYIQLLGKEITSIWPTQTKRTSEFSFSFAREG